MSWPYRKIIRPFLFEQDEEHSHERALALLGLAGREAIAGKILNYFFAAPELPVELFGLRFPNPVGLAAGMDKAAAAVPVWEKLGFGFCELGGVTWHKQLGNPRPRMFRAVEDEAIVNSMGFNNPGAEAVAQSLAEWKRLERWPQHPVGINLGKSKITPLEKAAGDYADSFRILRPHADFFVVNVSSPNTHGLRKLQEQPALDEILAAIQEQNGSRKPILVKVSPDLSFDALDKILELAGPRNIAGVVATNTTHSRPHANDPDLERIYARPGGLSGRPLRARSTEIIRHIFKQTNGKLPVIGVGGIFSADDAWEKIAAGASLLQIYTGLVFEGPDLAKKIVTGLREKLELAGMKNLQEAAGSNFEASRIPAS
jgi:dihydroorotate dehydrogenase